MNKDSFVFRRDWFTALEGLEDSVRHEVYDAIMRLVFKGESSILSPIAETAMLFILPQIERDRDRYNSICEQRKVFGSKGGLAKASISYQKLPFASKDKQTLANASNNDNDIQDTNVSMSIEEKDTNVSKKKKSFVRPTIEEVEAYIREKNYVGIDAEAFVNYYDASGWMRGKTKITSWKSCLATWNRNNKKDEVSKPQNTDNRPRYIKFNEWVDDNLQYLRSYDPLQDEDEFEEVLKLLGGEDLIMYNMSQVNNYACSGRCRTTSGRLYSVIKEYCSAS